MALRARARGVIGFAQRSRPRATVLRSRSMQIRNYTKIIATVGPATASVDAIRALIRAGATCCRLNFSHGDGTTLEPVMAKVREAARLEQRDVAILADIQGPKLRIGHMPK